MMEGRVAPAPGVPASWQQGQQQQRPVECRRAAGGGRPGVSAAHGGTGGAASPAPNPYSHVSIAAVLALHTDAMRAMSVLGFAEYTVGMLADLAEEKKRLEEELAVERERGRKLACVARAIVGMDPEPLQRLAALRECLDSLGSFDARDGPVGRAAAGSADPPSGGAAPPATPRATSRTDQEPDDTRASDNDRTQVREPDAGAASTTNERTELPPPSEPSADRPIENGGVEIPSTTVFDNSFDSTTVDIEVPVRDVEEDESYESSSGSRRLRATPQRARKKIKRSSARSWQVDSTSAVDWQSSPVGRSASVPRILQSSYSAPPLTVTSNGASFGDAFGSRSCQQPGHAPASPRLAPASALSSGSGRRNSRHSVTFGDSPIQEAIQKPKASSAVKENQTTVSPPPAPTAGSDESSPRRPVLSALSLTSATEVLRSRATSHPLPGSVCFDGENVPQISSLPGPLHNTNLAPKPAAPASQRTAVAPTLMLTNPGQLTMPAPFATILVSREHFDAYWRLKHPAPSRPRPVVADCAELTWDAKNPFPFPTLHLGPCGTLIALIGMTRTYGYAYFILTYLVTGSDDGSPHFTLIPCFSKGDVYISAGEVTGLTAEVEEELRTAKKRQCLLYGDISDSHAKALLKYLENLP